MCARPWTATLILTRHTGSEFELSAESALAQDVWSHRRVVVVLSLGYLAIRLLNLLELWMASQTQQPTGSPNPLGAPTTYFVHTETPASPGLSGVLANWDGQWYERIATDGYPTAAET